MSHRNSHKLTNSFSTDFDLSDSYTTVIWDL